MKEQPFATLSADQLRFLAALRQAGVSFIVIGGYAVRAHGCLRATTDLDLLVDRSAKNVLRVRTALAAVDACRLEEAVELLSRSNRALVRWSDNELFAVEGQFAFDDAFPQAVAVAFEKHSLLVISSFQLVEAKRYAASRPARGEKSVQDLKDIECLTKAERM